MLTSPGDFEEVYGAKEGNPQGHEVQDGKWDAVVTCFFIDTVRSLALIEALDMSTSYTQGKKHC